MARMWQCGFELNSATTGVECTVSGVAATVQGIVFRSGSYAGKIDSLSSGTRAGFLNRFSPTSSDGPYYARIYFRVDVLPSANNTILSFVATNSLAGTVAACIKLTSTGTLLLCNSTGTQIGSASSALSTGQFYRIEIKFDRSPAGGSQTLEAKLNGTVFATDSTLTIASQVQAFCIGGNLQAEAQTTGTWYFDDIGINDSTGSYQNSYLGSGMIVHALPNGAGDNTQWTIGGSVPAATNYQSINEATPDDGTTLVSRNTINQIDDYTVSSISAINNGDTINTVAVGTRQAGLGAGGSNATFATRLKAITGGTVDQGSTVPSQGTTWITNAITTSGCVNYGLVDYVKPGTSSVWTKSDLTAAQIGIKLVATNTNAIQVSALWLSVDYTPAVSGSNIFGDEGMVS